MTRRGHGEGSIGLLKDGRWLGRASLDGRRKAFYGKTRSDVAKRLSVAIKAHQDGLPTPSDRQSFAEFTEKWISAIAPTIREKTAINYANLLRNHAIPVIGKIPMTKLQPADLIRLYDKRRKAGAATSIDTPPAPRTFSCPAFR